MSEPRFQRFLAIAKGFPYLGMPDAQVVCDNLDELDHLAKSVYLEKPYRGIENLADFRSIKEISISKFEEQWMDYLEALPKLRILKLQFLRNDSLPSMERLNALRVLILYSCKRLSSLRFLEAIPNLHSLCLSQVMAAHDLAPLATLSSIRELWIDGCIHKSKVVMSFAPIGELSKLQYLQLITRVDKGTQTPLRPLGNLKDLRELYLADCFSPDEYDWLLGQCPKLRRIRFPFQKQWPPTS